MSDASAAAAGMTLEIKRVGPMVVDDEEKGEVSAIVATIGVVDLDRDVILPEVEIEGSGVKLSSYDHDTPLEGQPPVGKGLAKVDGDKLVFKGRYFLSTMRGLEAFRTTKELGEDGEWSFGYVVTKTAKMTKEWADRGAKRLILGLLVKEASPVFQGAGIDTRTVSVKSAKDAAEEEESARLKAEQEVVAAEAERVAAEEKAAAEAAETKRLADEAEAKAARDAAQQKARTFAAVEEYHRVQRLLKRMGYA